MDTALIANEFQDSRLKGEDSSTRCKVDVEKAYDHVKQEFLFNILNQMGFGEMWLKQIGF